MAKPNYYWELGKFPDFKTDFQNLEPYEQWLVDKIIQSMRLVKDPTKKYKATKCID